MSESFTVARRRENPWPNQAGFSNTQGKHRLYANGFLKKTHKIQSMMAFSLSWVCFCCIIRAEAGVHAELSLLLLNQLLLAVERSATPDNPSKLKKLWSCEKHSCRYLSFYVFFSVSLLWRIHVIYFSWKPATFQTLNIYIRFLISYWISFWFCNTESVQAPAE